MNSIRIGLLEDDAVVAQMLEMAFAGSGWLCDSFETLTDIKQALTALSYDLLVLDWMVPDGTVETLIPWVRESLGWEIPILIESLLGDEPRIVRALGLGANDYVVKPLRLAEVNARIRALLRNQRSTHRPIMAHGPYRIDTAQRELTMDGEPVKLTRVELDLVIYFFRHAGELLSRERLLADVWGISAPLETRTVDYHVSRLRKKLRMGTSGVVMITCMPGYGYRLETEAAGGETHPPG
ncbi:Phosphate regulon transcriptional regulatory protein PhoB [Thiorhodovibrio winogradskyi]|uniref:Phosphate regulon transcriptional regulatory protein PhoB n=1 Tax=Thiorhodovibrio winogradskyi TaxID=77007 RepID=A0ABZ0SCK0_9GAMM|nr:response regulator transcription factor [Thiorhodovibrio winogradskyi]